MNKSLEVIIVVLFSMTVVILLICLYHLIKIKHKQIDIEKRIKRIDTHVVPSTDTKTANR